MSTNGLIWFLVLVLALTAFALWGVEQVPFHPDESTYLYKSIDFNLLITRPWEMAWIPGTEPDRQMRYRLLDAPLTRYLLGLGRTLSGLSAPPVDWEWSQTFQENMLSGALPKSRVLTVGRITITLLLPFTLLFLYLTGQQIAGTVNGLAAVLALGLNALTLLHGRRAMAEGALLFGISIAVWSFLHCERRPWLAGLGIALAFSAKHSTLVLLPVGLLAVIWDVPSRKPDAHHNGSLNGFRACLPGRFTRARVLPWGKSILQYGLVFIGVTFLLNPYLWRSPIQAAVATVEQRQDLLQKQVADTIRVAPERVISNPFERLAYAMANLHFAQPSFAEWGNYMSATAASEQHYLAIPGHNLLRNLSGGAASLILATLGFILCLVRLRRAGPYEFRALNLALLSTLALAAGLILFVPLTWQRYVIPLAPVTALWQGYAIARLAVAIKDTQKHRELTQ